MIELNKIYNESNYKTIERMEDESIDCLVTSPPYWGLRDYGVEGQLGLEKTVEEFVGKLVDIFTAFMPKLKKEGTIWVNLGDTYGGSNSRASNNGRAGFGTEREGVYKRGIAKCLMQVPNRFSIAMTEHGWILRNEIIWRKPNAMPQSATDRFTVDYEKIFFFTKSEKYYFEQQFEEFVSKPEGLRNKGAENYGINALGNGKPAMSEGARDWYKKGARNKRTVWDINTEACSEAHFAVYPKELVINCMKAGCPKNGIVYDPFMGSGTTGIVALELFCNYVGSEINPNYCTIAEKRIEPYKMQTNLFHNAS